MQLEYLSMAGFAFVLMLLITVIVEACTAGLPAIASGDFAVVGFSDICAPLPSAHCLPCCDEVLLTSTAALEASPVSKCF